MKLSRNFNQRKALIRTQLNALISSGYITTTIAKAKMIQPIFDHLLFKAKEATLHSRRQIVKELANVSSANRLMDVIAPLFSGKKSGFTSAKKVKIRKGDGVTLVTVKILAELPKPELEIKAKEVKSEEVKPEKKAKPSKKTS